MIIYKTTNLITGKIYVGQDSKNKPNYLGSGKYLWNAINKHGKENFKKEIICECFSKEDLNEKEKYWIKTLNCKVPNGYNITEGGDGVVGRKHTEEEKVQIREQMKGNKYSLGSKRSEEFKNNIREINKGNKYNLGRKQTEEHKRKTGEKSKGRVKSFEERKNISIRMKGNKNCIGRKHTDEEKKKIGEKSKGKRLSEETKLKMRKPKSNTEKIGKYKRTEEIKLKMRNSRKLYLEKRKNENSDLSTLPS